MDQLPAEQSRPRRRIVPIVDSRFQWKYTLLIMALGVGLTASAGALLYRAHMASTRLLDLSQNPQLQAEVMRDDQIFLLYLIVLVILMGVGLGFWGLIVTHRISGPLYIVARYLGVLGTGHYPDMRPLRKRDELQEFFSIFEEAVNGMRNRDLMMLRDVEVAIAEVEQAMQGDAKKGLEYSHQALKRYRTALADCLGSDNGVSVS